MNIRELSLALVHICLISSIGCAEASEGKMSEQDQSKPAPRSKSAINESPWAMPAQGLMANASYTLASFSNPENDGKTDADVQMPAQGQAQEWTYRGSLMKGNDFRTPIHLSPTERHLLVNADDGFRLYDILRRCELPPPMLTGREPSFSYDGRYVATSLSDAITIYDLSLDTHREVEDAKFAVFAPSSYMLAIVSSEGETVRLYDVTTGSVEKEIELGFEEDPAGFCAFSPDGSQLLTGAYRKDARLWDIASGKEIELPENRPRIYYPPVYSPDGKWQAHGFNDDDLVIYDSLSWEKVAQVKLPSAAVAFCFGENGRHVYVACRNDLCTIDVTSQELISRSRLKESISAASFNRSGTQVWIESDGIEVFSRDEAFAELAEFTAPITETDRIDDPGRYHVEAFNSSADGSLIIEVNSQEATRIRGVNTQVPVAEIPEDNSDYMDFVSASVPTALSVQYRFFEKNRESKIELVSMKEGKRIGEIPVSGTIAAGVVSDDAGRIAISLEEGRVLLLNARSGDKLGQIDTKEREVNGIDLNRDGSLLAVVFQPKNNSEQVTELQLYSTQDFQLVASYELRSDSSLPRFSPDGNLIATRDRDHITIRRLDNGQRVAVLRDLYGYPYEFSPDGRLIFCEVDGRNSNRCTRVCAFEVETGRILHEFHVAADFDGHDFSPQLLQVLPNGKQLAALIRGRIVWWHIPAGLVDAGSLQFAKGSEAEIGGEGIIAEALVIEPVRQRELGLNSANTVFLGPDMRTLWAVRRGRATQGGMNVELSRWNTHTGSTANGAVPIGRAGVPQLVSQDGNVWVAHEAGIDFWDAKQNRLIASHAGEGVGAYIAAIAPDGSSVLTRGQSDGMLLQHKPNGNRVQSSILATNFGKIEALAISPDNQRAVVAERSDDFNVWIVNLADPSERKLMKSVEGVYSARSTRFSPDGKFLVLCVDDEAVVWSTSSGEVAAHIEQGGIGRSLDISNDNRLLATYAEENNDGYVALWDLQRGFLRAKLMGPELYDEMAIIRFTDDGKHVHAASRKTYFCWEIPQAESPSHPLDTDAPDVEPNDLAALPLQLTLDLDVTGVRYSEGGTFLVGDGQRINLSTGVKTESFGDIDFEDVPNSQNSIGNIALVENNTPLGNSSPVRYTPQIMVWSEAEKKYERVVLRQQGIQEYFKSLQVPFGDCHGLAANEMLNRLATIHSDGKLRLWAVGNVRDAGAKSNQRYSAECKVIEIAESALCATFLQEGKFLFSGTGEGVAVFETDSAQSMGSLSGPTGAIHSIVIANSQQQMVTFGDKGLQLWQIEQQALSFAATLKAQILPADNVVTCVAFSPDDGFLAVGMASRSPLVYDIEGRAFISHGGGMSDGIRDLCFSADGQHLSAACDDGKTRVWKLQ